ncbi:MAG: hypothetical protein ACYCUG_02615 [Acidimicrobiales bacterium]
MSNLRPTRTRAAIAGVAVVAALACAGCGASSGGGNPVSATKQITADWTAFFNTKTPTGKRIALLQDGSAFASTIQSQAGSVLAKQASAKVLSVRRTSSTTAAVTYDVLLSGSPVLKDQKGTAVLKHGSWEVGTSSFCALLHLEGGAPPACASAAG